MQVLGGEVMSNSERMRALLRKTRAEYQRNEGDTGSTEVQGETILQGCVFTFACIGSQGAVAGACLDPICCIYHSPGLGHPLNFTPYNLTEISDAVQPRGVAK
jgi:hypothetical protein